MYSNHQSMKLKSYYHKFLSMERACRHINANVERFSIGKAFRPYSASSEASSTRTGGEKKEKSWSINREWKILGTVGIAIASWYINARQDRIHSRKQLQMDLVTKQLKELYGPLYGNRIVAETSYRAVMSGCGGLHTYLEQAKKNRDAEMIRRWRSFVWNVLYPLDKEAMELICNQAHLIVDKRFPEEFDRFLSHMAKMRFVMEQWKNEKGTLESVKDFTDEDFLEFTNSSGIGGSKSMINHLRERCKELRARQQIYFEDISVDNLTIDVLHRFTK